MRSTLEPLPSKGEGSRVLPLGRTLASSTLALDPETQVTEGGLGALGKQLQVENPWLSPLLSSFPFWLQQFWKQ